MLLKKKMEVFEAIDNSDINFFESNPERINEISQNKQFNPFIYAAYTGNLEMLQYFYDKGAVPTYKGPNGMSNVHLAAYNGQLSTLNFLISLTFDLFEYDSDGLQPIHVAAREDHLECVKAIIKSDSDFVNSLTEEVSNNYQFTPLHFAVYNDSVEMVKLLLYYNADFNIKDCFGNSPLDIAKKLHKEEIIKCFENYNVNIDLFEDCKKAIENDDVKTLKNILCPKGEIKQELLFEHDSSNNENLLIQYAIQKNSKKCFDILYGYHKETGQWCFTNDNGETILFNMLDKYLKGKNKNFYIKYIEELIKTIEVPLDIHIKSNETYNQSYLSKALYFNTDNKILDLLLSRKDLVVSEEDLFYVLSLDASIAKFKHGYWLQQILNHSPKLINKQINIDGYTPLGLAIRYNYCKGFKIKDYKEGNIFYILLNLKADPMLNFKNDEPIPIFHKIIEKGNYDLVQIIYETNQIGQINLNLINQEKRFALFYAYTSYNKKIIDYLSQKGASPLLFNNDNMPSDQQPIIEEINKSIQEAIKQGMEFNLDVPYLAYK